MQRKLYCFCNAGFKVKLLIKVKSPEANDHPCISFCKLRILGSLGDLKLSYLLLTLANFREKFADIREK